MHLYDVKIAHPRGGERNRVIASEKGPDHVAEKLEAIGLSVIEINVRARETIEAVIEPADAPVVDAIPPAPAENTPPPTLVVGTPLAAPTGRLYGRSAQGPRRNATEMAEDRRIEALAKHLDFDLSGAEGGFVAAGLLAELEAKVAKKDGN